MGTWFSVGVIKKRPPECGGWNAEVHHLGKKVMELFVPGYHFLRSGSSSKAENSVYCIYELIFRDRTHSETHM